MLYRRPGPVVAAAALAVAAALPFGCGGDEAQERSLTRSEADRLLGDLSAARQAAAAEDPAAVRTRLRSFRREVRQLAEANALTPAEERQLIVGAKQAEARAEQELSPAVPAQPDAPPQPVPPAPEGENGGDDRPEPQDGKEDDEGKPGKGNGDKGDGRGGKGPKGGKGNGGK